MRRNGLLFSIAVLIFSMVFSGCGEKEDLSGKQVIRYFQWGTPSQLETTKKLISKFELEHPDIKIIFTYADWAGYWSKLQIELAGNAAPDVCLMSGAYFFKFVENNQFLNLQPYIDRDKDIQMKDYYPFLVDLFKYNGDIYGVPRDFNSVALYYNKNLFDKFGVEYPNKNWTWEDFKEAAIKLTKDVDNDGRIDYYGCELAMDMESCWGNFVWQNGGEVLNESKTKCMLYQPEAIEAIQFLHDFIWKYKVATSPIEMQSYGWKGGFILGRVAMVPQGSWYLQEYRKYENINFEVEHLPIGKKRATSANGLCHVIYAKTKYPEESWQLVKFLSQEYAQEELVKTGAAIPAMIKVADSKLFLNPEVRPANKKVFLEAMEYAHDLDFTANWGEWNGERGWGLEFEAIWLNKRLVKQACEAAARKIDKLLSEKE
ncbi:MAG: sugar ABC transporter substrate-binding protein [Candidatus Omnitrophota bacterium]